jgi:hypothetical protein
MTRTRYDYPTTLAASNVAELLKLDGYSVELNGLWLATNAPAVAVSRVNAELWPDK